MGTGERIRVFICGAGIGGLTTAVALSEHPHIDVEIYEGASQLGEIGAGIGILPRVWEIIKRLGLDTELLKCTDSKPVEESVPTFRFRKSDQNIGSSFYTLMIKGTLMFFHRADFQRVLLRRLQDSCKTHCSKRLLSYKQQLSGPIELLFEDGSTITCDVLIGADGLKSAVRRTFLSEQAESALSEKRWAEVDNIRASVDPVWSGTTAYRAVIPAERLRARTPDHRSLREPTVFVGKNGHIITYPLSKGEMVNLAAFIARHDLENTSLHEPWTSVADISELTYMFSNWETDVQVLIECVESPLRWAIHTVKPLGSFASGHVALVGDAAHAMTPHQGSGAGQAIEDAYILATVLGHSATNKCSISRALHVYDTIRRPVALQVMERSRRNGRFFSLHGLDLEDLDDEKQLLILQKLGVTVAENWEWAWTTSIDGPMRAALQMLES